MHGQSDIQAFLPNFVDFFKSREFQFYGSDLDPADVRRASLMCRALVSAATSFSFGALGSFATGEGPNSTNQYLKMCLKEFSKHGDLVGIYLKYGQPVVLLLLGGDDPNDEEFLARFRVVHELTSGMSDFSLQLPGGRLPCRSLVFTVFTSHAKSMHFKDQLAARCKRFSLFRKVWVLPWTIDLERKRVFKYSGLPVTEFGERLLEKAFFDKPNPAP